MDRNAFIVYLQTVVAKGADGVKELVADITEHAADVRQTFYRVGHTRGKQDGTSEMETIKAERDGLIAERDQLKTETETLKQGQRGTADLIRDHNEKMLAASNRHKEELRTKDETIVTLRKDNTRTEFMAAATSGKGGGLRDIYAENLYERLVREGRIKWDAQGKVTVYEVDKATPYAPSNAGDETIWHVVARDEKKRAPDDMIVVKSDKGSDTSSARASGGGSGGGKTKYDEIREEEEARRTRQTRVTTPEKSAEERMGVRR